MASSKGGDDEQSQVLAILFVHVYTRTRMVPNLVRNSKQVIYKR